MSNWTTAEPVTMKILLSIILSFSILGCDGGPADGSGPKAPRETTGTNNATNSGNATSSSNGLPFDLSRISYSTGSSSDTAYDYDDEERTPTTLCNVVHPVYDYVGLVEVIDVGDNVTSPICTEKEYRSIHRVIQLERIADAYVSPVVVEPVITATWVAQTPYPPRLGDYLLVTIRESQGELFLVGQLIVLPSGYDIAEPYERTELNIPSDFAELTARTGEIMADYPGECPDVVSLPLDDATYATWIRDPDCSSKSGSEEDVGVDVPLADVGSSEDPGDESDAGM